MREDWCTLCLTVSWVSNFPSFIGYGIFSTVCQVNNRGTTAMSLEPDFLLRNMGDQQVGAKRRGAGGIA